MNEPNDMISFALCDTVGKCVRCNELILQNEEGYIEFVNFKDKYYHIDCFFIE